MYEQRDRHDGDPRYCFSSVRNRKAHFVLTNAPFVVGGFEHVDLSRHRSVFLRFLRLTVEHSARHLAAAGDSASLQALLSLAEQMPQLPGAQRGYLAGDESATLAVWSAAEAEELQSFVSRLVQLVPTAASMSIEIVK